MLPDIVEQIESDPPNVWLTSFYGFNPDEWGCVGFSLGGQRDTYLRETKRGNLIVVYGAKNKETPEEERGKVLGFMQMSRDTGHSHKWISPMQIERNKRLGRLDKWTDAVKAKRAFKIIPEDRPTIEEFAPVTYTSNNLQHVGSQGVRLLPEEAIRLLEYEYAEQSVYAENPLAVTTIAKLKPSKGMAGARKNYTVIVEPDGPKELYILRLKGNKTHFLGKPDAKLKGMEIIKVGLSKSPQTRCNHFNWSMPDCAFEWEVLMTTKQDIGEVYANQDIALAGEDKMKTILDEYGTSLGGEFFLAHQDTIDEAWFAGRRAALRKAAE
jgi:hypothetical protein